MLILLALVFAAAAGIALHYVLPHRETRGVALAPLGATAIAAVLYTSLTWVGLAEDNPWLWAVSLSVPAIATGVLVVTLARTRIAHDIRERSRLRV